MTTATMPINVGVVRMLSRNSNMQEAYDLLASRPSLRRLAWVSRGCRLKLTPSSKLVYVWICTIAGDGGAVITWPGNRIVAELLACCAHSVGEAIEQLLSLRCIALGDDGRLYDGAQITLLDPPSLKTFSERANPSEPTAADDQRDLACLSIQNMQNYLMFGKAILTDEEKSTARPARFNWMAVRGRTKEDPNLEFWTLQHLMGYYWFLVCWRRSKVNLPLSLPNWGKLGKLMKDSNKSNAQLYKLMRDVVTFWDHIVFLAGKRIHLELTEATMFNSIVQEKLLILYGLSVEEQRAIYDRAQNEQHSYIEED